MKDYLPDHFIDGFVDSPYNYSAAVDYIELASTSGPAAAADISSRRRTLTIFRVFLAMTGAVGVGANSVVGFVLLYSKPSRTKTVNLFLINQMVLDFLVSFFLVVLEILKITGSVRSSRLLCALFDSGASSAFCGNASRFSLTVIAAERYVKICRPVFHRNYCQRSMLYAGCALPWIYGLVTCPIYDRLLRSNCLVGPVAGRILALTGFIGHYILPVVLSILSYSQIIRAVCRSNQIAHNSSKVATTSRNEDGSNVALTSAGESRSGQDGQEAYDSRIGLAATTVASRGTTSRHARCGGRGKGRFPLGELNILQTMIIVTAVYAVTEIPIELSNVLYNFQIAHVDQTFVIFAFTVGFINHCLHPFIYAGRLDSFKVSWTSIVERLTGRNRACSNNGGPDVSGLNTAGMGQEMSAVISMRKNQLTTRLGS